MPGQIVHCVMARQDTNEPNRLIAASIGVARPADPNMYGYLSEHHSYGETAKKAGEYAEDLAATMLATTLGIEFDPEKAWSEREQAFKLEKSFLKTRNVVQSAEGHAQGPVVHRRRARRLHLLSEPRAMPEITLRHEIDTDEDTYWAKCVFDAEFNEKLYTRRAQVPGVESSRLEGRRRKI